MNEQAKEKKHSRFVAAAAAAKFANNKQQTNITGRNRSTMFDRCLMLVYSDVLLCNTFRLSTSDTTVRGVNEHTIVIILQLQKCVEFQASTTNTQSIFGAEN